MDLPPAASEGARALARQAGLSVTAADWLFSRGLRDAAGVARFLDPLLAHLTPPDAMAGRDAAADRIARAVREDQHVVVFGDYDCDGITSAAIATETLRALGGRVTPLLGTRFGGGYGLSDEALARVLGARPGLVVTCDCGAADGDRIRRAREASVDTIVVDHHVVPADPPPAVAFLNPRRADCGFPFKDLASCGLVLSLLAAVRSHLGASLDLRRWLDLVAIGTIADVVPLCGDNRVLVRAGLGAIGRGERPGLRALAAAARVGRDGRVGAEDVAFRLAPRLNAPGRLGPPDLALALLLERDPDRARALAQETEQAQGRRRAVGQELLDAAVAQVEERGAGDAAGLVVAGRGWHAGVVGIVAGRLAERYGRPVAVVALDGAAGRGSVRGPRGFPLHDALATCAGVLLRFGGHQAAAGLEVEEARVPELRERFEAACAAIGARAPSADAPRGADVRLDDGDDLGQLAADLDRMEPFGEGNPTPRIGLDADVAGAKSVRGGHLRLTLRRADGPLGAFGPGLGHLAGSLSGRARAAGKLRRDRWRGDGAVELELSAVERL